MSLLKDVRYGTRLLGRSPIFTAVAVLSLALSIGAGTAIFSLVNAILLRSLPVPNPHELRLIKWSGADWEKWQDKIAIDTGRDRSNRWLGDAISVRGFQVLREQSAAQANVFGYCAIPGGTTFRARREASWAQGLMVSGNFFSGLGARPLIGRLLGTDDELAGAAPVVVISYQLWEDQFGLDPAAIGQSVTLGKFSFTVVGVLPRAFPGVQPGTRTDFYASLSVQPQLSPKLTWGDPDIWWVQPMVRLRSGVSDSQFQATLSVVFMREAQALKIKEPKVWMTAGRAGQGENRDYYKGPLMQLLWVVGVVLLVACANLAGLMLARGAARQHEFAVRAALGAGKGRLVRQSLTESVVIALLGGGLGVVIAIWGKTAIGRLLAGSPDGLHYDTSLDLKVLAFTLGASLVTALLSGLLPALRAASVDPLAGLKDRATPGAPRVRAGRFLVAAQITLALLLVGVAGLFVRTLFNLTHVNTGYAIDHLLVFRLRCDNVGYQWPQSSAFFERVLEALATTPGVQSAALTFYRPLTYEGNSGRYKIPGNASGFGPTTTSWTTGAYVSETFFTTMGIPLVLGRDLRATDTLGAPKVVVVNETFVRQYLVGRNPIGLAISDEKGEDWQIVGVCRDAKYRHIKEEVRPIVHRSFRQVKLPFANVILRTGLPPIAVTAAARKAVAAIDPNVPLTEVSTLEQLRDASIREERTFASLCGSLAVLALLLSCIGIYGLMAYQVARRTIEIGIRQALGATRRQIARPILREALGLAATGVVIGTLLTLALTRGIRSPPSEAGGLYGVGPADPVTFCGAAILFLVVALLAAWIPARRATRVDPMVALRNE
ncbi:MAG: efflux pump, inner rane subunit [Verrucomicrobiales bacterium]|nr:efflux pump, inner rane subunit [Verrucomicrobiales bacterium]